VCRPRVWWGHYVARLLVMSSSLFGAAHVGITAAAALQTDKIRLRRSGGRYAVSRSSEHF